MNDDKQRCIITEVAEIMASKYRLEKDKLVQLIIELIVAESMGRDLSEIQRKYNVSAEVINEIFNEINKQAVRDN